MVGELAGFIDTCPSLGSYKVAVDDASPLQCIWRHSGQQHWRRPSRTDNAQGIQNADWKVVLDWDGHQPATEPGKSRHRIWRKTGRTLSRIDMKTGEIVDIQPQPAGRWAPRTVQLGFSHPCESTSLLPSILLLKGYGSRKNRVMRGQQFHPILPKTRTGCNHPSWAAHRIWQCLGFAMSNYNTITSLSESPIQKIFVRGHRRWPHPGDWRWWQNWRKIDITALPECRQQPLSTISKPTFDAATGVGSTTTRVAISKPNDI